MLFYGTAKSIRRLRRLRRFENNPPVSWRA